MKYVLNTWQISAHLVQHSKLLDAKSAFLIESKGTGSRESVLFA